MLKDFYSFLQNVYTDIEFKNLNYYLAKKAENGNLPSLDYYAREFLSKFYQAEIETKEETKYYLALWKYEALLHNIKYAQQNTEHYKNICTLKEIDRLLLELEEKKASSELTEQDLNAEFAKLTALLPFSTSYDLEQASEAFLAVSSDKIVGVSNLDPKGKVYQVKDINSVISTDSNAKKRIYYSSIDLSSMLLFIFFGMQDIVKKQDAKVLLMMSPGKAKSAGVFFCATMQKLGVDCKVINFSSDCEYITQTVLDFNANILFGVPWNLHALSAYMKSKNIKHEINAVILNGDTASQSMRKQIGDNFACEVFHHYGMTEIGFGGAVECSLHHGLHVRMLDIALEIVDENLQKVEDGTEGEIVITTLTRNAMPLIRYRTGDRGRIVPDDGCKCNSSLQRLEVIGFMGQGVQVTKEKFIHLAEFQDFFYRYFRQEVENNYLKNTDILDFEIALFKDREKSLNCMLIGLEMGYENKEDKTFFLKLIRNLFAQYFNLCPLENIERVFLDDDEQLGQVKDREKEAIETIEEKEEIDAFYICTKEKYDSILQRNAERQLLEGEDFESSKELDKAFALSVSKLDTFFTAKKIVHQVSGKILDIE